jgi:hypothetical protein
MKRNGEADRKKARIREFHMRTVERARGGRTAGAAGALLALAVAFLAPACSIEKMAMKKAAGMLAGPGSADVFS